MTIRLEDRHAYFFLRCSALAPALSLIYGGRVNEGLALFRLLYERPDAPQQEQKTMELVRKSPLWIAP